MSAQIEISPMLLLEMKLVQALEEKLAAGWIINPNVGFDPDLCMCCLLGAQVTIEERNRGWDSGYDGYFSTGASKLGIPDVRATALEAGFMGESFDYGHPEYQQLGAKLREKYVK